MKKKIAFALAALLTAASLAACGSSASSDSSSKSGEPAEKETSSEQASTDVGGGYTIELNGTTVGVDMDMDTLTDALGAEKSKFEAASCAGDGTAYTYDYGAFQIETYPADDGKNLVGYITLMDDTVATDEGIDLDSSIDDVKAAYGDPTDESDAALTYEKDGMKLIFTISGDSITSIQYASKVMG